MKEALVSLLVVALLERRHLTLILGGTVKLVTGEWGYGHIRVTGGGLPDSGYGSGEVIEAVDEFLQRVAEEALQAKT